MPLTPNQILEIQKIIELHHYAYVANTVGHDAVPEEVLIDLDKKGLLSSESLDLVKQAYLYGQSIAQINDEKARLMPYDKFQDYVKKNPVPLSNMEQRAIAMAQVNAGQYCRGLGNTIEKTTGAILIEADQQLRIRFEGDIKTAVAMNRAKRETISKLKSDLGWATKDWARDLERIAITETMFAVQQGQADYLSDKYGSDSFVAKIPNPSACPHCLRLHIGEDGQPRVFKLSTLENNGANVGRKAADWRAVVGPVHPNCVCLMIRVPDGWGFDEEGELVPGGKLGIKYEEPKELELSLQNDFMKSLRELTSIEVQGIPISIETKEGEARSWINSDGSIGETIMRGAAYGFVKNTASMDEEELDVFVGPYPESPMVYVIEQQNPKTELYDEQKCMIGFRNEEHARSVYNANYTSDIDFILVVEPMTINHFKRWSGFEIKKDWVKKGGQLQGFGIAGHRSPGPGLGVNYYIPVPEKEKDEKGEGYGLEAGDLFNEIGEGTSVYVPKEAYEFNNTIIPVHPLVIPEQIEEAHKDARKDAKKNKKVVDDKAKLDKTSRLDTKSLGDIDLEKGGPYIGPRGGKWADPKHTIPWDEDTGKGKAVSDSSDKKGKPGSQLPEGIQSKLVELKIDKLPQASIPVEDIRVDLEGDVDKKAVIAWKDTKGKWQSGYTPKFHENSAKKKWERINSIRDKVPGILKDIESKLSISEPGSNEHQGLTILAIIGETGLRPGSTKSVQSHGHYGISTLLNSHVRKDGNVMALSFVGKSGKDNKTIVQNKETIKALEHYMASKPEGGSLFNPNSVDISKKILPKGMKVKDFRTVKATVTAEKLISLIDEPPPLTGNVKKDKKLLANALYETSKKVATILNNTPAIAKASYIHPSVFEKWANSVGASKELWAG